METAISVGMLPYVKGDYVLVPDRRTASTLINKGNYGKPVSGGGLELSLMEAAYLLEEGRLEIKRSKNGRKAGQHEIISRGIRTSERFFENYLVFRDIRNRGVNIQGGDGRTFMTYPRGKGPGRGKADNWIIVNREHDPVFLKDLHSEAERRQNMRMGLLAAVVDGDFDVSYYSVSGSIPFPSGPLDYIGMEAGPGEAEEVPGGGLLSFSGKLKEKGEKEGLGTDLNGIKAFSIEESSYLTGKVGSGEMDRIKDTVYRDLRSRGYLVRTGFKYGSHFRVYSSGSIEEHSDLLVHCTKPEDEFTWEQLARAIRLSHSVRKRMLFAFISGNEDVSYLELNWKRP